MVEKTINAKVYTGERPRKGANKEFIQSRAGQTVEYDIDEITNLLTDRLQGEVRFDAGSRALYATDSSNYRQTPIGVVIPKSVEDVIQTVEVAREYGLPVLARGGGTSLAGQCCNVALVMDMSKYLHHILQLDPQRKIARVQPGTVLDDLRTEAEKHHLTFGPDPATHSHNTLGGMIGNNSCGVHSVMAGKTDENIEELDILTYDGLHMRVGKTSEEDLKRIIQLGGRKGEIYAKLKALRDRYAHLIREKYPDIPRRVSGFNLPYLLPENGFHVARALVGSESTCVTVLEATVKLVDSPPGRTLLVLGYPDVYAAGDHVPEIMSFHPIGLEGIDDRLVNFMKKEKKHDKDLHLLPEGNGWLLVEFGGQDKQESDDKARQLIDALKQQDHPPSTKLYDDREEEERVWVIRESGLGATAMIPHEPLTWPGWEDSAVPPERVGNYLRDLRKLLDKFGYSCSLYGHFGQGCIHTRIDFDLVTPAGIQKYRDFVDQAADLVVSYGGSLSGEHGDGQSRAALLPKMFGEELMGAMGEFKAIWDPQGKMNPGKVIDPFQPDENLRLGENYAPWEPDTHFGFAVDEHRFSRAALRCVGVGNCRQELQGTMCPSYMVTREEKDSTRGRARLLFEMLQGETIGKNGWRDESVKDALDLCLACKGCKGDCPVNVDMATYKSEFLSHYYDGHIRPRVAYSMGLIRYWSVIASKLPLVANFFTQAPLVREAAKFVAGIDFHRRIPAFAPQTFKKWFSHRTPRNPNGPEVMLWADTFNNYFHPETEIAAVEVLEDAGFHVTLPQQNLCCGRPLYDWGMLDLARRTLNAVLDGLKDALESGTPIVVLEPSCASVFRDELPNLLWQEKRAKKLSKQVFTLDEFLQKKAKGYRIPALNRKAIVHGHCHHKAVLRIAAEETILNKMGLDAHTLNDGCCGMAGSFGFEKGEHYEVSLRVGERILLPEVRQAPRSTLVVADGFSCREQIAQQTDRQALHLAQVLQMAIRERDGQEVAPVEYPEHGVVRENEGKPIYTVILAGLGVVLAGLTFIGLRRRSKKN